MLSWCFANSLQEGEYRIECGIIGPIDDRSSTPVGRQQKFPIVDTLKGLTDTGSHKRFYIVSVQTSTPSSSTASMSKEDLSGPFSAWPRVITTD